MNRRLNITVQIIILIHKNRYLYTAENVLKELDKGSIDFGLFAIHNAKGGIVWESARAMAKYTFRIREEFGVLIHHVLMKRKDIPVDKLTHIVAHPQVFLQRKKNLERYWKQLIQISGKGNMIDTAKSAETVSKGLLPKTYAVLGPKTLDAIHNFDIIAENLQDLKNNITYFFLVSR